MSVHLLSVTDVETIPKMETRGAETLKQFPFSMVCMQVVDIDRVVIASDDLERTAKTLTDRLGLDFGATMDVLAETDAGDVHVKSTISTGSTGLDIVEPLGDDDAFSSFVEAQGTALYALAVRVVDIERARAELAEQGVEPVGTIQEGDFTEYFYHPDDFDGLLVYLAEFPHPYETNHEPP